MRIIHALLICLAPFLIAAGKDTVLFDPGIVKLSLEERIIRTAYLFVNREVSLDPLGEGFGFDPDPLLSTSKFDCTTYVEVVLAVSLSNKEDETLQNINRIRYRNNKVSFYNRNHFMVSDWIPENVKLGLISPILIEGTFPRKAFKKGKRRLNKTTWFYHRIIDLLEKQGKGSKEILAALKQVPEINNRKEEASYLLATYFRENTDKMKMILPKVSLVMFIRNMPTLPTLVTHMGLLVQEQSKLYLYHAPRRRPWKVSRELLEDYFLEMDKHRAPIEGLLLYKINKI